MKKHSLPGDSLGTQKSNIVVISSLLSYLLQLPSTIVFVCVKPDRREFDIRPENRTNPESRTKCLVGIPPLSFISCLHSYRELGKCAHHVPAKRLDCDTWRAKTYGAG